MPGVEYLSDQPGDAEPEELLDAERRPLPRWVVIITVAVIALAIFTITRNNLASHTQLAAPSPSPTLLFPSFPSLHRSPVGLDVDSSVGAPILTGPSLDVAVAGDTSWVLQPHALVAIVRHHRQEVRIPGPALGGDASVAELVLDVPSGVLWVVEQGGAPGRLFEYDVVGLHLIRQLPAPGPVTGAAALDGHLYVTSSDRLFDVAAGRSPVTVARVQRILGGVVADPARHRLLMFGFGPNTQLWPITLTAKGRATVSKPAVVALGKPTLGVAEGSVWIAGYDGGRWVLSRLDPRTLQPTTGSPLAAQFATNGAVIVATGVVVIWVRDQTDGQLRCIDAVTGDQLQAWMVEGAVASGGAHGLVATSTGAVPLALSACSG